MKNTSKYNLIKSNVVFLLILGVTLFSACKNPREQVVLLRNQSPYQILRDTIIATDFRIEPGVVVEIGDSVCVTFLGNVTVNGSTQEKVLFKPVNTSWESLKFEGEGCSHHFSHVTFENGRLFFKSKSDVEFLDVFFKNNAIQDQKNGLIIMKGGGSFFGDGINMTSNNTGEGIVVSGLDSMTVKNSIFKNVNDAVELMMSKNGLIENCTFDYSKHDDGVDLDGCENVVIRGNTFAGIADNCIEVGLDNYSHRYSLDIIIENNIFSSSKVGVLSKEYSEIEFNNNSFLNCKKEIEIIDTAYVVF